METAVSTLSTMPSSKEQVMAFTRNYKAELLAGIHDPLKQLALLKHIEKFLKNILTDDEIDDLMVRECEKYGKENVEINGFKLNIQETGIKYFYEETGDPVWNDLNKQIEELTKKRKEREQFLQRLDEKGFVDPDTGLYVNKPARTSKTKVVVK